MLLFSLVLVFQVTAQDGYQFTNFKDGRVFCITDESSVCEGKDVFYDCDIMLKKELAFFYFDMRGTDDGLQRISRQQTPSIVITLLNGEQFFTQALDSKASDVDLIISVIVKWTFLINWDEIYSWDASSSYEDMFDMKKIDRASFISRIRDIGIKEMAFSPLGGERENVYFRMDVTRQLSQTFMRMCDWLGNKMGDHSFYTASEDAGASGVKKRKGGFLSRSFMKSYSLRMALNVRKKLKVVNLEYRRAEKNNDAEACAELHEKKLRLEQELHCWQEAAKMYDKEE